MHRCGCCLSTSSSSPRQGNKALCSALVGSFGCRAWIALLEYVARARKAGCLLTEPATSFKATRPRCYNPEGKAGVFCLRRPVRTLSRAHKSYEKLQIPQASWGFLCDLLPRTPHQPPRRATQFANPAETFGWQPVLQGFPKAESSPVIQIAVYLKADGAGCIYGIWFVWGIYWTYFMLRV